MEHLICKYRSLIQSYHQDGEIITHNLNIDAKHLVICVFDKDGKLLIYSWDYHVVEASKMNSHNAISIVLNDSAKYEFPLCVVVHG